ncbi:GTP cyclohydrolase I FolE [bacterium]|nr:GTP cyclohydrolase I FolE [bacterium]
MSTTEQIAFHISQILHLLGEDVTRPGLIDTPKRVAKALQDAVRGKQIDLRSIVGQATFETTSKNMVVVRNMPFFSTCEHHLMPFEGIVSVGYVPNGTVLGLSKIPRIVEKFSKQLQIQEELTCQIASAINDLAGAKGSIVVIRALHSCMRARGIQSDGEMVTTAVTGVFEDSATLRTEFWNTLDTHAHR